MNIKEKFESLKEKASKLPRKLGRRGVTIICAVVLIACAVVLNAALFRGEENENHEEKKNGLAISLDGLSDDDVEAVGAGAESSGGGSSSSTTDYFASVTLGRQQARDEAMEVLHEVTENENAQADAKEAALKDLNQMALDIEREASIEAMVKAKGFEECIAVLSGERANVIVKSDTLTPGETAQISEIVYEAAGIPPERLTITEKSGD